MGYKEDFIEFMVRSGVLKFGDFTAKSGRKTPYFINAGDYNTSKQISKLGEYYAAAFSQFAKDKADVIFGPAYKGIPLAVTMSVSLYRDYNIDIPFCFNRKEAKDHGEGGSLIGYSPKPKDRIILVDDVITAGTAVRESIEFLKKFDDIEITTLIISVDRMERGQNEKSAFQEIKEDYGIETIPIVNIQEIKEYLYNREIDGKVYITDEIRSNIEQYLDIYGVK